jgi:Phage gp6-like head-tail connector protein
MGQTVTVVTPPAVEPVTLAEAKLHLRVDFGDDDALIYEQISSARQLCEAVGKQTMVNTVFTLVDDSFPFSTGPLSRACRQFYGQFSSGQGAMMPALLAVNAGVITFPRAPLVSIQSIYYLDANGILQLLPSSSYDVQTGAPGRVQTVFGTPWPVTLPVIGSVMLQFTAGYGPDNTTVPASCKSAVKLILGWLYRNRDAGVPPETLLQMAARLMGANNNAGGYG